MHNSTLSESAEHTIQSALTVQAIHHAEMVCIIKWCIIEHVQPAGVEDVFSDDICMSAYPI